MSKENANSLEEALRELMESGDCSIVEKRNDKIFKVSITKAGQKNGKAATVDEINQAIAAGLRIEGAKRVYRKGSELADPSKEHTAEVNMLTSKLTPRVSRPHVDLFNACADKFDGRGGKRLALEQAIELLADHCKVSKDDFLL